MLALVSQHTSTRGEWRVVQTLQVPFEASNGPVDDPLAFTWCGGVGGFGMGSSRYINPRFIQRFSSSLSSYGLCNTPLNPRNWKGGRYSMTSSTSFPDSVSLSSCSVFAFRPWRRRVVARQGSAAVAQRVQKFELPSSLTPMRNRPADREERRANADEKKPTKNMTKSSFNSTTMSTKT
jgi:hypothetical protein